ncbi:MAG: hypothetical protein ISS92_05355 [Candidatus Omnitrophica bacterium]|nr:hypothetical protein [Candidatus Omnitrophota bacterium]
MGKLLIFGLLSVSLFLFPIAGFSQEDIPQEGDAEYGYGTVVELRENSNELVISEYDWESDEEGEVVYYVDDAVEIENVDSWKELPVGTPIDIEYITGEKDKKVITRINYYDTEAMEPNTE